MTSFKGVIAAPVFPAVVDRLVLGLDTQRNSDEKSGTIKTRQRQLGEAQRIGVNYGFP